MATRPPPPALLLVLLLCLATLADRLGLASALEPLPSDVKARADAALQQAARGQSGRTGGCGTAPLVILYGQTPPTSLSALIEDQPPLPRLPQIASGADVELHSAAEAGCLSSVKRIRGTLLVLDDGGAFGSTSPLALLSNLQRVDESLIVYGAGPSSSLTSLSGLASLESVGHLALARLPKLATVQGLERLRAINGGFVFWRLPELQTLDSMGPVQAVQERVWIENTPKLLSLGKLPPLPPVAPVQVGVKPPTSKVVVKQQQAQDSQQLSSGLSALRSVGLDLHVQKTDLPSLELPYLATVGGEVALLDNARLASTQGLRALTSTFGIALIGNDLLADVDGFARLAELKGDLSVVMNRVLQGVNGFSRLARVGLTVDVSSNPALRSLDGFRGLSAVGQTLNIAFNPSLEALRGFGSLATVGADLIVRNNTNMRTLTDLGTNLTSVGGGTAGGALIVEGNTALASLAPLASPPLRSVRGAVRVRAGNGLAGAGAPEAAAALEALAQPGVEMGAPATTTTTMTPTPTTPTPTPTPTTPTTTTAPTTVAPGPASARAAVPPSRQLAPAAAPTAMGPAAAATAPAAAAPLPPWPVVVGGGGGDAFVNTLLSG